MCEVLEMFVVGVFLLFCFGFVSLVFYFVLFFLHVLTDICDANFITAKVLFCQC